MVERLCPNYEARIAVAPYDRVSDRPVLTLVARHDSNYYRPLPVQSVADETIARINLALQRVFLLGAAREQEVVNLLTRFQETIIEYARYDRPDQLKRALDVYEHLIEQRLRRGVGDTGRVSFSFHQLPDFLSGFGYGELAEGTVNSSDREKIEVVLVFAVRVMTLAIEHEHAGLLHRAGDLLAAVYWHGHAREGLQPWLGHTIDMWINHVLERFHVRRIFIGDDHDETRRDAELPLLKVALAWVLGLIKIAMEAERQQDAEDFQSRIFMFDRHFHLRQPRLYRERSPAALSVTFDLHVYALVILAGWCLYLARSCGRRTDAVKRVLQRCVADCGTRHDLILTWERLYQRSSVGSSIDSELGVEHWHEPDRRWRSGVPQQPVFARSWVPDGFVLLGLVRPPAREYEVPDGLQEPPAVGYDVGAIESTANALIQDDYTRTELMHLDESAAQLARDQFLSLIHERACTAKRAALERVVDAPLYTAKRDEIDGEVRQHVGSHRTMLGVIEKLGGLSRDAVVSLMPARIGVKASKCNFIEGEHGSVNLGEVLVQRIAEGESVRLAQAVEGHADEVGSVSNLNELASAVRGAIGKLRGRGFEPTLVIVPFLPHALQALTGARWASSLGNVDGSRAVRYEGIPIVQYPYIDAESVTIVDVGGFFGKAGFAPSATLLQIVVDGRFSAENRARLDAARHENDPARIPVAHDLDVLVEVRMLLGAGLCDMHAAVRVKLDPRGLGYAFRETDNQYHRPNCAAAGGATDLKYTLDSRHAAHFGERDPCPVCMPDQWAEEAAPARAP